MSIPLVHSLHCFHIPLYCFPLFLSEILGKDKRARKEDLRTRAGDVPHFFVVAAMRFCEKPLQLQAPPRTFADHRILADIFFQTKLLLAYAKCGDLHTASHLFDAINPKSDVAWNAILAGFSQHGHHQETLDAFSVMYKSAVAPNSYSFAGALAASAALKQLVFGRQTHGCIAKSGWGSSVFVATALVGMYGKCSSVADSRKVFDEMPRRNAVTWNAMICACCAEEPDCQEGLALFRKMVWTCELAPDRFTLAAVLRLCSSTAAMEQGKQVHGHAMKMSLEDVFVQSCLVEMYSKCGFIEIARRVFERSKNQGDLVLWTAMISGYGKHGKSEQVVELFDRMLSEGIKPDDVTFVVVLSACSHQGLVNKGCNYFRSMAMICACCAEEPDCQEGLALFL